jgi:hypothetical protein
MFDVRIFDCYLADDVAGVDSNQANADRQDHACDHAEIGKSRGDAQRSKGNRFDNEADRELLPAELVELLLALNESFMPGDVDFFVGVLRIVVWLRMKGLNVLVPVCGFGVDVVRRLRTAVWLYGHDQDCSRLWYCKMKSERDTDCTQMRVDITCRPQVDRRIPTSPWACVGDDFSQHTVDGFHYVQAGMSSLDTL